MSGRQFIILFVFVAVGILGVAVVMVYFYYEKVYKPDQIIQELVVSPEVGQETLPPPDPGKRVFDEAVDLIGEGDLDNGLVQLAYVMRFYPDSATYPEARRIFGEINVDRLLSDGPGPGKSEYTIKSGDALANIARRHDTTIDYIMRANGRMGDIIHIGDKVWVSPLNFAMEAKLGARKVIVYRLQDLNASGPDQFLLSDEQLEEAEGSSAPVEVFFKEYDIVDVNLPPTIRVPTRTQIDGKSASLDSRLVRFNETGYHDALKVMRSGRPGLLLHDSQADENDPNALNSGILLSPEDMKELFTYIRYGTEFRVSE